MARGILEYISLYDGFAKKIDKADGDSLQLLSNLKADYSNLFFNDMACGHGASIKIFDCCELVFHYVFNNGSWRDKTALFDKKY